MDKLLIKNIQNFGFTENESKIYLAALECGTSSASILADRAGLNRITAYGTAQKCLKKGILSVSEIQGVTNFTALDPEVFFEEQQRKLEKLKSSVNVLKSLGRMSDHKPSVQFFEGISGLKYAYAKTLSSATEILSIANSQNIRDFWQEYDREYVQKRAEKKIFLRALAPEDKKGRKVQQDDVKYFRKTKLLSSELFSVKKIENEISIFDDNVLIASFESHPFAILIESHTVAETQRQMFELMWERE